jgi:hypothetical protein
LAAGEAWGTSKHLSETITMAMHRTSASRTSPAVAHELAITTAYEKSLAIFSRVSKVTMSRLPLPQWGV